MNRQVTSKRRVRGEGPSRRVFPLSVLALIRHLLTLTLLLCIVGYVTGWSKTRDLPPESDLVPELFTEPLQRATAIAPFTFDYRNVEYAVSPQASYDISGLVVSHNDILSWWDIYHDENSVDIKDICLIWGQNADEDIYQNMKFWNESVSCHAQGSILPHGKRFYGPALSNNHLLSADPEVREKIRAVRVGDQIRMRGYLVNYNDAKTPQFVRKSSLTRSDSAGFACEVMYVTELEVLRMAPRTWHDLYELCRRWMLLLVGMKLVTLVVFPWIEFKLT